MVSSEHIGCTTSSSPSFYRMPELNMMGLVDSSAVDAATTALRLELSADRMDVNVMNITQHAQASTAYWSGGGHGHSQQVVVSQESVGYFYTSAASGSGSASAIQDLDSSVGASQLLFPASIYKNVTGSGEIIFPYKYEGSCDYSLNPHGGPDQPGANSSLQLQALRDFMSYPPTGNGQLQPSSPGAPSSTGQGQALFLHLGEEPATSLLSPQGRNQILDFQQDGPGCKQLDSMSNYRALCPTDMFTATAAGMHLERSPHRSQFQRENHIMAERQRREEMNEKFTALRSMIPKATKKDKASIVGDTINYVLELEKTLKHLQGCKAARKASAPFPHTSQKQAPSHNTTFFDACAMKTQSAAASNSTTGLHVCLQDDERPRCGPMCEERKQLSMSHDQCTSTDRCLDDAAATCNHRFGTNSMKPFKLGRASHSCSPAGPLLSGPSDHLEEGGKNVNSTGADAQAHVEVQKLKDQAIIKIMCTRSPGLVFRIMHALDLCKVELLQGNVTTVDNSTIHFITVQLIAGISSSTEELVRALHNASTGNGSQ